MPNFSQINKSWLEHLHIKCFFSKNSTNKKKKATRTLIRFITLFNFYPDAFKKIKLSHQLYRKYFKL